MEEKSESKLEKTLKEVYPDNTLREKIDVLLQYDRECIPIAAFFENQMFMWTKRRDKTFTNLLLNARQCFCDYGLEKSQALFGIIETRDNGNLCHIMPNGGMIIGDLYDKYKRDNGLLFILFQLENTFG